MYITSTSDTKDIYCTDSGENSTGLARADSSEREREREREREMHCGWLMNEKKFTK